MKSEILTSIQEVDREEWNSIVPEHFPFGRWEHFACLERSNCVGGRSGWEPQYITLREGKKLVGATYLYEKLHSYGEYIFDWQWAGLAEQMGLIYYPKLTSAIPFTPVTGPKFFIASQSDATLVRSLLIEQAKNITIENNYSSLHYLFLEKNEFSFFAENDWIVRETYQFHWHNNGYKTFDDFLTAMKQKKAKEIRRERNKVAQNQFRFKCIKGNDLDDELASFLYDSYLQTIDKKQSFAYLNEEYFLQAFKNLSQNIRLFVAYDGEGPVACSLCYHGGNKLYGRYWGSRYQVDGLHFELCYYLPIEYSIAHHIEAFEAGAQGPHKIQRGFLPQKTYSAHYCTNPQLEQFVKTIVDHENQSLDAGLAEFNKSLPYRR